MLNAQQLDDMFLEPSELLAHPEEAEDFQGYEIMGAFLASACYRKLMTLFVHSLIKADLVPAIGYQVEDFKLPKYERDFNTYFDSDVSFTEYHEIMTAQINSIMRGYGWDIYESQEIILDEDDIESYYSDTEAARDKISMSLYESGFPDGIASYLLDDGGISEYYLDMQDTSVIRLYTNKRLSNYFNKCSEQSDHDFMNQIINKISMMNVQNRALFDSFWYKGDFYFVELQNSYFNSETYLMVYGGGHNFDMTIIPTFAKINEKLSELGY